MITIVHIKNEQDTFLLSLVVCKNNCLSLISQIELREAYMMQKTYNHLRIQVNAGMITVKLRCVFLFMLISKCVYTSINLRQI